MMTELFTNENKKQILNHLSLFVHRKHHWPYANLLINTAITIEWERLKGGNSFFTSEQNQPR